MIAVRELEVAYGDTVVARVPSLDLDAARSSAWPARAGSGKSQTALALLGLSRGRRTRVAGDRAGRRGAARRERGAVGASCAAAGSR